MKKKPHKPLLVRRYHKRYKKASTIKAMLEFGVGEIIGLASMTLSAFAYYKTKPRRCTAQKSKFNESPCRKVIIETEIEDGFVVEYCKDGHRTITAKVVPGIKKPGRKVIRSKSYRR